MLSKAALLACLSSLICTAAAACSSNLVIDNYTKWSTHTNSLGEWTGDDSSMTSISKSGTKLLFTPKTDGSSYFYTSFACIDTATLGYNAITFPIKAPKAASSLVLEIQTSVGCTAAYTSRYYVVSGLGTTTTTVTVPLSKFGTGSVATTAFLWSSLTSGAWELGETSFVCSAGTTTGIVASTSTTSSTKASSSTSTVAPSATTTSTKPSVTTTPTGTCSPLLIDDWASQSRLTFLYYNAMLEVSGSFEDSPRHN